MKFEFHWIGGATFILTIDDVKIAVDPVLCDKGTSQDYFWFKSKRIEDPEYQLDDFDEIDLWLITHNHDDHLDEIGLSIISNQSKIISNQNSLRKLKTKGIKDLEVLKWGQVLEFKIKNLSFNIEAIPAIHGVNPISALLAGKVNGYLMTISNNNEKKVIYITSDTVYKSKVINAIGNRKIDLLIPNMGAAKQGTWIMTLTLNSKMLKKMIRKLNPNTVIPVHFGTFEHYKEPVEYIEKINDNRIKIIQPGEKLDF